MQDPQPRGQTPPVRCVPTALLAIPLSPDGAEASAPALKPASFPGIAPNQDVFLPEKELKLMALEGMPGAQLASPFQQNTAGGATSMGAPSRRVS